MSKSMSSGRPRSEASRAAILSAAFELLVARGWGGFTIEAVAAAARAGKTTIYRWWSSKALLAVEAFFFTTDDGLAFSESSSAEADFRDQVRRLSKLLEGAPGRALAEMLGASRSDAALAHALGKGWLEPRRVWGRKRMRKARASGELREGVDVDAALGVIYGPLYAPLLFGGTVPTGAALEAHLDIACHGVFRPTRTKRSSSAELALGRASD